VSVGSRANNNETSENSSRQLAGLEEPGNRRIRNGKLLSLDVLARSPAWIFERFPISFSSLRADKINVPLGNRCRAYSRFIRHFSVRVNDFDGRFELLTVRVPVLFFSNVENRARHTLYNNELAVFRRSFFGIFPFVRKRRGANTPSFFNTLPAHDFVS